MAREPQRREEPRQHLDAAVVPVEQALLARAKALEELTADSPVTGSAAPIKAVILHHLAIELRAIARRAALLVIGTERRATVILAIWAASMLASLGLMIAELVEGHPQALALIFIMVVVSMMAGQLLEERQR